MLVLLFPVVNFNFPEKQVFKCCWKCKILRYVLLYFKNLQYVAGAEICKQV